MIKLKDLLKEVQSKPLTVYHGTSSEFKKFDLKKTTQGIIWFTSDKNKILSNEAGAQGKGYIITAEVSINNPAGWDEYDKLGLGQIKGNGFDGVILKDADGQFDCFVFSPKQIKIIKSEKINTSKVSEVYTVTKLPQSDTRISSNFRDVAGEEEANTIQYNYEKYAVRAGINPTDLISHLQSGHGTIYNPYNSKDYLVGQFIGDTFAVSHFAPETGKTGIDMLLDLLHSSTPAIFAVPEKISNQLEKIGYKKVASNVPMRFKGDIKDKNILINNAVNREDLATLLEHWMEEAASDSLLSSDPRVKLFFDKLKSKNAISNDQRDQLKLSEQEDYKGQHLAPDKDGGAPLYDLTKIYPDDVYSSKAAEYYGDRSTDYSDAETVSIIQSARGTPNKQIKIYRAVPNINKETENKIKDISTVTGYVMKFGFPPVGGKYSDLYRELKYNKDALLEKLFAEMDTLKSKKLKGLEINSGDWVTINKRYAIGHGRSTLLGDYKILTKTVPAKHLFTTGDSLHEFGYDPS
jgi:hypothetical protein